MDTRQSRWAWILGAVVLVLLSGAVGYWLGAHRGMMFARPFGFGFGAFGFVGLLLLALLAALVVGAIVAVMTREPTRSETYEEWHRRAHAGEATGTTNEPMTVVDSTSAASPVAPPAVAPEDETVA